MKRYKLIESSVLYESDVTQRQFNKPMAYEMIKRLRSKQFKIDWDKIEKETGVKISDEDKLRCEHVFSAKTITMWDALNKSTLPLIGGSILLFFSSMLLKIELLTISIGIFTLIAWIIHMIYIEYFKYKHNITKVNPEIGIRVFDQMQQQGIDYSDIKKEWKVLWERHQFYSKDPVKAWAWTIGLLIVITILMEFTPLRFGLFR